MLNFSLPFFRLLIQNKTEIRKIETEIRKNVSEKSRESNRMIIIENLYYFFGSNVDNFLYFTLPQKCVYQNKARDVLSNSIASRNKLDITSGRSSCLRELHVNCIIERRSLTNWNISEHAD